MQRTQKHKKTSGRKFQDAMLFEHRLLTTGPYEPPTRSLVRKDTHIRRFVQFAAVGNQTFTLANGHDQFLVVTNVAGNAVPYVDSWRIKKIEAWALSAEDTATSVTITPVGADASNMRNDRESIFEMTSRSQAKPAYMGIVCSKTQPLGSWHFTSNTGFASGLFQVNVQGNTGVKNTRVTMDITFETITNLAGFPLGYGVVTGTTALGTVGGRNILSGFSLVGVNNLG